MSSPSVELPLLSREGPWATPSTSRLPPSRSERNGKLEKRFPRIVLRDSLGNKLDTFTYLQEAIYRAEWNVKNSHEAVLPEEWRLPKAPNPARPDYSRAAPPLANTRSRLKLKSLREQDVSRSFPHPRFSELDVNDVAFVAESLNQLPQVPSLSFLHHDLLAEPKRYFQIVHQALVQQRYYAQTDKRERVYNFPGFCMGCRRSGLCYGCERSSAPHYHIDRIMKTGGGFTYHKHDHPIRERPDKNPSNWKLAFPELALKHLIQEHENGSNSIAEEDVEVTEKLNVDIRGYQTVNQKASSEYGPQSVGEQLEEDSVGTQEEIVKQWAMMREGPLIDDRERGHNKNKDRLREENMDAMSPWSDPTSLNKRLIDENLFRGESHTTRGSEDITIRMESQSKQDYNDSSTDQGSQQLDVNVQKSEHSDRDDSGSVRSEHDLEDTVQNQTDNDADSEGEDDNKMKSSTKKRDKSYTSGTTGIDSQKSSKLGTTPNSRLGTTPNSRLGTTPNSTGDSSDKQDRGEDKSDKNGSSPYSPYSSRRRKPLYKAPPPFKIKHKKSRQIDSHSPFSTERHYDLPKGSGFQVKKSEKKLTEFKEFKHHEGNWMEPEKFTVKKSDKHSTDFWSPPKKKEAKKKERVKKQVRPVSPDSGLESEKPTGTKLKGQPHLFPITEQELNIAEVKERNLSSSGRLEKQNPVPSAASHISMGQRNVNNHKKKIRDVSLDSCKKANEQNVVCLKEEALDGETELNKGCCNEEVLKGKSKWNNTYVGYADKVFDKRDDQNISCFHEEVILGGIKQNDACHDEEALRRGNKQNNTHVPLDYVLDEINNQNVVSIGNEAWNEKNKQINDSHFEETYIHTTGKELKHCHQEDLSKDNIACDEPVIVKKTSKTEMDLLPEVSNIGRKGKNLQPEENFDHFENQHQDVSTVENMKFTKSNINGAHTLRTHSRNKSSATSNVISSLEIGQMNSKKILNSDISFKSVETEKEFREKKDVFERRLRIVKGREKRALNEKKSKETKKTGLLLPERSVETTTNESELLLHGRIQIDTPTEIPRGMLQKRRDDAGFLKDVITAKSLNLEQIPSSQHKSYHFSKDQRTDSAQELPLKSPAFIEAEQVLSPPLQKPISPVDEGTLPSLATPIVEQPKKERPKKTRKEVPKKLPSPVRSLTPKSPEPVVEEVQVTLKSREPTPEHVPTPTPKIPDLPPVDIPPLPEITEEKKEKKPKFDNRKPFEPIQVMPQIKDAVPPPPKKSKPPTITKKSLPKKRVPSAEAPVTTEEIRQMKDPLDFLAKYCIISKDRLPYYERIYKNVVSSQPERYERAHPLSPTTGMPVTEGTSWGNHELNMFHDLVVISRGQDPPRPALSEPEQYLEKICYTLEMLDGKHRQLAEDLNLLESKRIQQLAERARKLVPDITSVHFKKKEKKSKKKKKKKNKVEQEEIPAKVILSRADITDDVIVSRIDDKLLKKLMKEPAQHQLNCEIERCTEKLANIEDRLIQLEGEKNIIGMYCMELFFEAQNDNNKPREFRRQQSFLYKTLHPDPDVEMNKEELEGALQIVNHNLLSQNEFSYLYHILNLTGRRKINFKLFCVIAALSERITHMDPVIRDLLNKEKGWKRQSNDYESLDVRLNRSKELFQLLDEGDSVPFGNALASSLAVELTAGGLSPELTSYVMGKFNREGKGYVDFLDYVTYVPLFIEIHEKIINDPLCSTVRIQ